MWAVDVSASAATPSLSAPYIRPGGAASPMPGEALPAPPRVTVAL
jgi:hypothetical protein